VDTGRWNKYHGGDIKMKSRSVPEGNMPTQRQAERTSIVEEIARAIATTSIDLEGSELGLFEAFYREVARQLRPPFLARRSDQIGYELLALFRLFLNRAPTEILVQVEPRRPGDVLIHTVMLDQSFIVDTVRLLLSTRGGSYRTGFHAVLRVERDDNGRLTAVGSGELESVLQISATRIEAESVVGFSADLKGNLTLARAMVQDFGEMTSSVDRVAARFSRLSHRHPDRSDTFRESADFLNWLLSDNFVFMGTRWSGDCLGVENAEHNHLWPAWTGTNSVESSWGDSLPIRISKGTIESPVHRSGRIDEILLKVPDETGEARSELLIRGLFTYRAVTQPSRHVPVLRRLLAEILRHEESRPGSWRYKGVANVFDSLPTEFLFIGSVNEVILIVDRVLEAEAAQQVGVQMVQKPGSNMTFVVAAMPRGQYSDALRQRLQKILKRKTGATYLDHGVFVGRYDTVLVHFFLTGVRILDDKALGAVSRVLRAVATPWDDRLFDALRDVHDESEAQRLMSEYGSAFTETYSLHARPSQAVRDIELIEELGQDRRYVANIYVDRKGRLNLRIYQLENKSLSMLMPVLTEFGLDIADQYVEFVQTRSGRSVALDTFRLNGAWGLEDEEILDRREKLTKGLESVFEGQMAADGLNRLLLRADLSWKEVDIVRAYRGYARQLGISLTYQRVQEILLAHPRLIGRLVHYFHCRFDPDLVGDRATQMAAAAEDIEEALRRVHIHDEDLLLRSIYELMRATIRTNVYRTDRICWYVSFKVDHDLTKVVPEPRLKYEIYVHHPEVEGVHLRGGRIARGGIRWSDRDDYRTEVLGLVTTQMVKNVIIVPEGAKGGFFMKHVIRDRAARRRKADELYKFLIRGLLDLTDNIVDGENIPPDRVVCHDEPDPYLVVAADKGTAHLSDTANAVSREYGFWLDDAFASGGSNGYDHKVVGITARGGWESVNRHFAEMGLDPKTQTFTCAGIGDCAGDVFGNGVIEYPTMKLLAAFNHLHIFLDPDPSPQVSYRERKRLFKVVQGWDHYDTTKLSEGGGIFDRAAKSIPLSPQVKKMLGVLVDELTADQVIRLILRMDVDLLWNGGIGTYVKASHQTHRDAGDPSNDAVRINADELHCRAVGEGGNLGFTQAGRIEYAMKGGRLATDAIDNSGGVDMSDHEVNLKILLGPVLQRGDLDWESRNTLIASMTDQVTSLVLANSDRHGLQLSLDQIRSHRNAMLFSRSCDWVARHSKVAKATLDLPEHADFLARMETRQGLSRPELAVVAAHVKMQVYKWLLLADGSNIPNFSERIRAYFPSQVREVYGPEIDTHMLAHAIGMTELLNEVVGDAGASFFPQMLDLTSRPPGEILEAWFRVANGLELQALRADIGVCSASSSGRYRAWICVTDGLTGLLAAALAPGQAPVDAEMVTDMLAVLKKLGRHRTGEHKDRYNSRVNRLRSLGVAERLAQKTVACGDLTLAREIALVRRRTGDTVRDAIVRYLGVGRGSRLLPAIWAIEDRISADEWDQVAAGILRTRYFSLLQDLVQRTPLNPELRLGVDRVSHKLYWGPLNGVAKMVDDIVGSAPGVGALLVAEERLRAAVLS
jgi:glutamate dehydrogenase